MKSRSIFTLLAYTLIFGLLQMESWAAAPTFKKVMIIVLENADYDATLKQPGFAQLAKDGALFTNFDGETHPSQGNYIALVSGNEHGVHGDASVNIDAEHIGDRLEAKNKTWKTYLEDYPGNCFTGKKSGLYVRKHNPFISFKNIHSNPARCAAHLVEASALTEDVRTGNLPNYSLYIPNLKNDGHDTGVAYADRWFTRVFAPLLKNPSFMKDLLLIVTFDESADYFGNHIYTAFYGAGVAPGSSETSKHDHYSLLRLIEDQFGLESLGQNDRNAQKITGIWGSRRSR